MPDRFRTFYFSPANRIGLLLIGFVLHLSAPPSNAQSVYTWTDEHGGVHYSTTPENARAQKAELPQIERENIDQRIKDLQAATPPNCSQHGGIDCSRGADSDGSVICVDGFTSAMVPFRFHCLEARLRVSEFSLNFQDDRKQKEGERQSGQAVVPAGEKPGKAEREPLAVSLAGQSIQSRKLLYQYFPLGVLPAEKGSLHLVVRNTSDVEAYGIETKFLVPPKKLVVANGPERIEPFGIGEFTVSLGPDGPLGEKGSSLRVEDIVKVTYETKCTNCSASIGTRQMP